jgi:hypothetical protein
MTRLTIKLEYCKPQTKVNMETGHQFHNMTIIQQESVCAKAMRIGHLTFKLSDMTINTGTSGLIKLIIGREFDGNEHSTPSLVHWQQRVAAHSSRPKVMEKVTPFQRVVPSVAIPNRHVKLCQPRIKKRAYNFWTCSLTSPSFAYH